MGELAASRGASGGLTRELIALRGPLEVSTRELATSGGAPGGQ